MSKKQIILDTALKIASEKGYASITRDGLAEIIGVSQGIITYYFNPFTKLKYELLKLAVERNELPILMQAIGNGELKATALSPQVRKQLSKMLS